MPFSLRDCRIRSRAAILSLLLVLLLALWQPDVENGDPETTLEEVSLIQDRVSEIYSVRTGDTKVGSRAQAETQVKPLPSMSTDVEKSSPDASRFGVVRKLHPSGPLTVKFPRQPMEVTADGSVKISFALVFIAGTFFGIAVTISAQAMFNSQEAHFSRQSSLQTPPRNSPRPKAPVEQINEDDIEMSYTQSFNIEEFWPRASSLALLLILQSGSSIILQFFNDLLEEYTSLVYYFTMLVGLGGNAGVQSVVIAVRRFATGEPVSFVEQGSVGIRLALILAPLAFIRSFIQGTEVSICMVVGLAAFIICTFATVFATALTVALKNWDFDPAHASAAIQVLMDITGLAIVCAIATLAIRAHLLNDPV